MLKEPLISGGSFCAKGGRYAFFLAPIISLASFSAGLLAVFALRSINVSMPEKNSDSYSAILGEWWEIFGSLLFAPAIETLILLALYLVVSTKFRKSSAIFISATIFSALHGMTWWGWGVIAFIPSVILLIPFSLNIGKGRAYLFSALIHAFHNFYVLMLLRLLARDAPHF